VCVGRARVVQFGVKRVHSGCRRALSRQVSQSPSQSQALTTGQLIACEYDTDTDQYRTVRAEKKASSIAGLIFALGGSPSSHSAS
jgi:hypothetical protein